MRLKIKNITLSSLSLVLCSYNIMYGFSLNFLSTNKGGDKVTPGKFSRFARLAGVRSYSPFKRKWTLFKNLEKNMKYYPAPVSLPYAGSLGSLATVSLVIQIFSGVFLAMHYNSEIEFAFASIESIMLNVPYGWLARYIHGNSTSMFFIVVYAHIVSGMYYGSYMAPRQLVWLSGVFLFLLMMATAFTGYVLPWGQMSFWRATMFNDMVTMIPFVGQKLAAGLWEKWWFIPTPNLNMFFVIHFLLPFVVAGFTLLHLALLHRVGSGNPIGIDSGVDDVPFYSYFLSKDLFALSIYLIVFASFVSFSPNTLSHPDNYVMADPFETPPHVVPEWYFIPFYSMLRSIPHKTGGILAMFGSILILATLPYTDKSRIRSATFRPIYKWFLGMLFVDLVGLFALGYHPVEDYVQEIGLKFTFVYFFFFCVIVPNMARFERYLMDLAESEQESK